MQRLFRHALAVGGLRLTLRPRNLEQFRYRGSRRKQSSIRQKSHYSSKSWITGTAPWPLKGTETPTDVNEPVVSYASFAAELRRGGFARFVVMLGGVETKDVLTLT